MKDEDETKSNLIRIYTGLRKCGKKMTEAAQFLDFFVHDILDFTVLNKDLKNFNAENTIFDIREAIKQIINI